jgi:hypothetical protein
MQPLETDSARSARVSLLIQAEEIVNCRVGVRGVCTRGEKEIAIPERIARVFPARAHQAERPTLPPARSITVTPSGHR